VINTITIFSAALVSMTLIPTTHASNEMNPAISMILQGQYAGYEQSPDGYELPGFMLGGEAGLNSEGFGLGHGELVMSSNIDDRFFGKLTLAIADHDGATEIELEEAFIETTGLSYGLTVKAGRFFSDIGYLNNQHTHAWDFIDAPLIYRGLFGNQLIDDGLQLRWLAPTDFYIQLGAEFGRGERFPSGGASNDGKGTQLLFAEFGGDVGDSHSWQLGLSHWSAEVVGRQSDAHAHGGATETPSFTGDSDISVIDIVWKWAPQGNYSQRHLTLQFEYFQREEIGDVELIGSNPLETTTYDGKQDGGYAQVVYQFMPRWQAGLRYDQIEADNRGSDDAILGEAGLDNEGHTPKRTSIMLEHNHSEFSLVRLQFNKDESYENSDDQVYLQYVMSLGAHGAHRF